MGEVTVQTGIRWRPDVWDAGRSTDVIEASAKAYVDGLNRLAQHTVAAAGKRK